MAVHTVRVFFRTHGAWRKLLVLVVPVATVPLQWLMAKIGFATPSL